MDEIKTTVCQNCGNSVLQQQLPNGEDYYCCHYCGFSSTTALVIIAALENLNFRTEQGDSHVK